jgi:hypothetical protein
MVDYERLLFEEDNKSRILDRNVRREPHISFEALRLADT